jgi:hypothetical protein
LGLSKGSVLYQKRILCSNTYRDIYESLLSTRIIGLGRTSRIENIPIDSDEDVKLSLSK